MNTATQTLTANAQLHPGPISHDPGLVMIKRATRVLQQWAQRARQRHQLSNLTVRELDDIGVSFEAAAAEAAKPFWQA